MCPHLVLDCHSVGAVLPQELCEQNIGPLYDVTGPPMERVVSAFCKFVLLQIRQQLPLRCRNFSLWRGSFSSVFQISFFSGSPLKRLCPAPRSAIVVVTKMLFLNFPDCHFQRRRVLSAVFPDSVSHTSRYSFGEWCLNKRLHVIEW
jgi:hypothetical protein